MCHSPSHFSAGFAFGERLDGIVNLHRRAVAAELARVEFRERLVHFQDRVDGTLDDAGHVADHIGHGHQVLVVDAFLSRGLFDVHQLAQRNERRSSGGAGLGQRVGVAGPDAQREQFIGCGARGARQLEHDVHVFLLAREVEQIDRLAANGDAQRLRDRLGADAVQRGLFLVDDEARLRLVGLDIPIHIDHARRAFENVAHFAGERVAVGFGRAVNLGDKRLQHWRAGRHFGDGDARIVARGDRGDARTYALRDVVALGATLAFRKKVHLNVGDVRALAQKVVAHEAVEIIRRSNPGVDLVIGHFRFRADGGSDFARGLRGAFERAALRACSGSPGTRSCYRRAAFSLSPSRSRRSPSRATAAR